MPTNLRESKNSIPTGKNSRHGRKSLWRLFKRLLKMVLLIVVCVALLLVSGVFSVVLLYRSVVGVHPGGLETGVEAGELGASVDPFIGTGGVPWVCAYNSPAATIPFGMVRLGPDTASILIDRPVLNASGYYFGDNKILGFSHTRLLGADSREGGHFRILPTTKSRERKETGKKPFARFSHREEVAFPGYYAVRLPKERVLVELAATPR